MTRIIASLFIASKRKVYNNLIINVFFTCTASACSDNSPTSTGTDGYCELVDNFFLPLVDCLMICVTDNYDAFI